MPIVIRRARVLTLGDQPGPRRGGAMSGLGVRGGCDVLIEQGRIAAIGESLPASGVREIDAGGRVLMPGFVDCHTHACWAGQRLDDWERSRRGESYLQILQSGGGIMSTVRAVRAASERALAGSLRARLDVMLREGTTTAEVKSGYGLTAPDEIKMLGAIRLAGAGWAGTLVPTALLGHAIDPDDPGFAARTVAQTLPEVSAAFPGIAVDAYCEEGAWSVAQTVLLLSRARSLGHPIRVHADQFTSLGMLREAVELGAVSVDHLEASRPTDLALLAASPTIGVVLPGCGFHLERPRSRRDDDLDDGRDYANARAVIDAGGAVAIASNCNPGSSPCSSMPMVIALAVRRCGMEPGEAITAATVNAAAVLGLEDRGRIAPGLRADLVLLRHTDERSLAWEFGGDPVDLVIAGGKVVGGKVVGGKVVAE